MNLENMLLVPSKSRYELEIEKYGSEGAARGHFIERTWKKVLGRHYIQKENIQKIVQRLGRERIIDRPELTSDMIEKNDLIVIPGGDDHFKYCSQCVLRYMQEHPGEQRYVLGVKLDSGSTAALLYADVGKFLESLPRLEKDDFLVENWTALEAKVKTDSEIIIPYPAVADYFVGEYGRLAMSRNEIYLDGKNIFPDKSSGLLVATGTASSKGAWYDNIHYSMFKENDEFGKQEESARVILTENRSRSKMTLHKGQVLDIYSYNDSHGIVAPDSVEEHSADFNIGAQAEIKISDLKLKVIRL